MNEAGEQNSKENDLKGVLRERAKSSKRISWLLDECIRIPGTQIRFGLDPIIGLIPWGGETIATLMGATVLGEATKKGIPFKTLLRMGANMIVNAGVGTIPVIGDLFSAWFKSNSKNYRMLNEFLDSEDGAQASGGWWPVILVIATVGIVLLLNVLSWFFMFAFIREIITTLMAG